MVLTSLSLNLFVSILGILILGGGSVPRLVKLYDLKITLNIHTTYRVQMVIWCLGSG